MKWLLATWVLILVLGLEGPAHAAPGDIFAEIMASPESPTSWVSEPHAFLCLSVESASGVQENCFGFYNTSRPPRVCIGSPGLSGFFQKPTVKFPKVSWSLKKKIGETQPQQFLAFVAKVNGGGLDLWAGKTGDFIAEVVTLFGWKNGDPEGGVNESPPCTPRHDGQA